MASHTLEQFCYESDPSSTNPQICEGDLDDDEVWLLSQFRSRFGHISLVDAIRERHRLDPNDIFRYLFDQMAADGEDRSSNEDDSDSNDNGNVGDGNNGVGDSSPTGVVQQQQKIIDNIFQCDICNESYTNKKLLQWHKMMHKKEAKKQAKRRRLSNFNHGKLMKQ